jgi:hypothetical protein
MKKLLTAATCLIFLALLVQGTASAQHVSKATGDKKFDAQLQKINEEAKADPDDFIRRLSERHNIPEQEIREAKAKHGLDDADIYMATTLARRTHRRVGDVAAEYKQNQGKGWGVMAQRMGIKPGSAEFKQMKAEAKDHVGQMKTMAKNKKKIQKLEMAKEREYGKKMKDEAQGKGQGKGKKK